MILGLVKTAFRILVIIGGAAISYVMYKGLRQETEKTKDMTLSETLLAEPLREFGRNKFLLLVIGGFVVYTWVALEAQIVAAVIGAIVVYGWLMIVWRKIKPSVAPFIEAIYPTTITA